MVVFVKGFICKNYQLICLLMGFLLYCLFGIVLSYIIMIIVGMFIFWGKATERIDLYNIDLLIYILYTLFSIFSLLVLKKEITNELVIILGLQILCSYYINGKFHL